MSEDETTTQTRRETLKYGGAIAATGMLAGCLGNSGSGSNDSETPADTATETEASSETPADDEATQTDTESKSAATATQTEDSSYTVTIAPTGDITFEKPPESAIAYSANYGDMLVALGQSDTFIATTDNQYPTYPYEDLDIDFSPEQLDVALRDGSFTKEVLFEIDPDIIHIDPTIAMQWFGFDKAGIEEVEANVGPWAANYIRRKGDDWHDYPYYSLYEAFEKIANVYQQQERYEAFKALHDETISTIQSRLPSEGNRPSIGLVTLGSDTENGDIVGLPIEQQLGKKQYVDLKIPNAFSELEAEGAFYKMDYEGLLEVDPETIVVPWGMLQSEEKFRNTFIKPMKEDPVGSQVAAVQNDRVFRGGTANQGPIVNLVNTEIAAHQLYPDEFGEEQLFDRQRVADIVNGDF